MQKKKRTASAMALAVCMSLILTVMILTSCKTVKLGEKAATDARDSAAKNVAESVVKDTADSAAAIKPKGSAGIISNILGRTVMDPECSKASLSFVEVSGKKGVCIYRNTASLLLSNDGEVNIAGINIHVKGKDIGEVTIGVKNSIGVGSTSMQIIRYDRQMYGELESVRVVPVINVDGNDVICSQKGIEESGISACE